MANLVLKHIDKVYDNNVQAVFDFNLDIKDKEFIVFVGPSGCGKSTTLRMIAGLEDITAGEFFINEKLMNDVEPKNRDIAMVFQSYALYPHMTVYENMAFGLKLKKVEKAEIDQRVREAARILEIEDYLDRKPKALSGGQRQRVALGRAIVRNAQVFLMDEPLSNLDAKLRVQMRSEIIKLHERIGCTTVYVTHDQTEAMTMATRIVVMKDGYIQQVGEPKEIYNNPANMFVASFIGAPAMNFLHGTYEDNCFTCAEHRFEMPEMFHEAMKEYNGAEVVFGIRPENIFVEEIVQSAYPSSRFTMHVDVSELLGHEYILHGNFHEQSIQAKVDSRCNVKHHEDVLMAMELSKVHFFDKESGKLII